MTDIAEDEKPPHLLQVIPIVAIVLAVAALARVVFGDQRVEWGTWTIFVASSAALLGLPALFWALDFRKTRLWQLIVLGAVMAAVPMAALAASGVIGRLARWGWDQTGVILVRNGAPIPIYGYMSWPYLAEIEAQATLVGAASGCVYWALFIRRRLP
jgi:hypothetical protein